MLEPIDRGKNSTLKRTNDQIIAAQKIEEDNLKNEPGYSEYEMFRAWLLEKIETGEMNLGYFRERVKFALLSTNVKLVRMMTLMSMDETAKADYRRVITSEFNKIHKKK